MANIMVIEPEAFSEEYEEFEASIRESMEKEEKDIAAFMKIFGVTREQAQEIVMDTRKRVQTAEEIMAEMGW